MDTMLDWRDWHIPLSTRHITLAFSYNCPFILRPWRCGTEGPTG